MGSLSILKKSLKSLNSSNSLVLWMKILKLREKHNMPKIPQWVTVLGVKSVPPYSLLKDSPVGLAASK